MDLAEHLRTLLDRRALAAAWLFGSHTRGAAGPDSDVDVGVLLGRRAKGLADLGFALADDLAGHLGRAVDLVVLDDAPADLVHRVLAEGLLLVEHDRAARVAFEVRKQNEYYDLSPMYRLTRRLPGGTAP